MEENAVEPTGEVVETTEQPSQIETLTKEKKALEQALSRQGYELGELRKMTDKILMNQVENTKKPDEPVDYFVDPDKAVDHRIAKNPQLQELATIAQDLKKQALVASLKNSHPDFAEVVGNTDFQEWIVASKVRQRLYQEADQRFDIDAATELLDNWKERQTIRKTGEAEANQKSEKDKALKAAKVDTGTSAVNSKKVYSRLDLMRLRTSDPDAYKSINVNELYRQGRVK